MCSKFKDKSGVFVLILAHHHHYLQSSGARDTGRDQVGGHVPHVHVRPPPIHRPQRSGQAADD